MGKLKRFTSAATEPESNSCDDDSSGASAENPPEAVFIDASGGKCKCFEANASTENESAEPEYVSLNTSEDVSSGTTESPPGPPGVVFIDASGGKCKHFEASASAENAESVSLNTCEDDSSDVSAECPPVAALDSITWNSLENGSFKKSAGILGGSDDSCVSFENGSVCASAGNISFGDKGDVLGRDKSGNFGDGPFGDKNFSACASENNCCEDASSGASEENPPEVVFLDASGKCSAENESAEPESVSLNTCEDDSSGVSAESPPEVVALDSFRWNSLENGAIKKSRTADTHDDFFVSFENDSVRASGNTSFEDKGSKGGVLGGDKSGNFGDDPFGDKHFSACASENNCCEDTSSSVSEENPPEVVFLDASGGKCKYLEATENESVEPESVPLNICEDGPSKIIVSVESPSAVVALDSFRWNSLENGSFKKSVDTFGDSDDFLFISENGSVCVSGNNSFEDKDSNCDVPGGAKSGNIGDGDKNFSACVSGNNSFEDKGFNCDSFDLPGGAKSGNIGDGDKNFSACVSGNNSFEDKGSNFDSFDVPRGAKSGNFGDGDKNFSACGSGNCLKTFEDTDFESSGHDSSRDFCS